MRFPMRVKQLQPSSVRRGDLKHFPANSSQAPEWGKLETYPFVQRSSILSPTSPENFRRLALIEKVMSKTNASLETQNLVWLWRTFGVIWRASNCTSKYTLYCAGRIWRTSIHHLFQSICLCLSLFWSRIFQMAIYLSSDKTEGLGTLYLIVSVQIPSLEKMSNWSP